MSLTRKSYYDTLNKAINELAKSMYRQNSTHAKNRITYRNIQNLKQAVKNRRRANNATANVKNTNTNFRVGNKRVTTNFVNLVNENGNGPGLYDWVIIKNMPNGTKKHYSTMAYNTNLPFNNNDEIIGFSRHVASPRITAAIKIQRFWRDKKAKGPFNNPEMQRILMRRIMPRLPMKNRPSLAGAFRPPTLFNKELIEQRKRTNKHWKSLLNNMTQKAIMRGSTEKLTGEEFNKLHKQGIIVYNFQHQPKYRTYIPNNKRAAAASIVRKMRKR
jgi:hypothetical protein